jgi:hypothetical protein
VQVLHFQTCFIPPAITLLTIIPIPQYMARGTSCESHHAIVPTSYVQIFPSSFSFQISTVYQVLTQAHYDKTSSGTLC